MNLYSPVISGSLTVTGSTSFIGNVTMTGTVSATASNATLLNGTGSVGFTTTGSFATMSGSVSSRVSQIETVYATTGSNSFRATQSITGSLTVTGQIIAQTLNVQQVTSSIVYSSGSNVFGCDINSRQTFTGSFYQTGSVASFSDRLGVGTVSPTSGLEVITNGASLNAIRSTTSQAYNAGPETSVVFRYKHNTAGDYISGAIINAAKDNNTDGNQSGNLQFWTNCAGTIAEKMRITSCGNVGIGITTPYQTAKLQVNVGANMNFAVQPGTACTTGIKLNTFVDSGASNVSLELNGNILYLKTCENSRLVINGSGISCFACQVYVGTDKLCWTDTVFKTLQVGNGAFNNTGTQTQIVNNVYYDDTNYRSLIGGPSNRLIMTGPGDLIFEYACTQAVGCIVSLSPKLFVCGINGRVGIGTSTPSSKLHIYGSDSELGIQVAKNGSDTVGNGPYIAVQNLVNSRQWITQLTADNHLATYYWGGSNYTERYRFNTGGSFTVPGQPAMLAQPGAVTFPVGTSQTAYGWCVSGGVRFNNGFTFSAATSAACNIADAQNTGKIIIPADGRYILQFSQRNEGQITSDGQFFLWVNGTQRIRRHIELWNGKPYVHVDVTAVLSLSTNDTLEMGAWFNSSGRTDTFSGTQDQVNWLSLAKIS